MRRAGSNRRSTSSVSATVRRALLGGMCALAGLAITPPAFAQATVTNLTASYYDATRVGLSWTTPLADTALKFEIHQGSSSGFTVSPGNLVHTYTAPGRKRCQEVADPRNCFEVLITGLTGVMSNATYFKVVTVATDSSKSAASAAAQVPGPFFTGIAVSKLFWNSTDRSVNRGAFVGSESISGGRFQHIVRPQHGYVEFTVTSQHTFYVTYLQPLPPPAFYPPPETGRLPVHEGYFVFTSSNLNIKNTADNTGRILQLTAVTTSNDNGNFVGPSLSPGRYYLAVYTRSVPGRAEVVVTPAASALGGAMNPIVFPGTPQELGFSNDVLSWNQTEHSHTGFEIFYATAAGIDASSSSQVVENGAAGLACSDGRCTYDTAHLGLTVGQTYHFKVAGLGSTDPVPNGARMRSVLSSDEVSGTPLLAPTVSADGRTLTFIQGSTSSAENRVCAPLPDIMDGKATLDHAFTNLPNWLEHRSGDRQQLCVKVGQMAPEPTTAPHIRLTYRVSESAGAMREATAAITIRVNPVPPPESSSSSSGGAIALVAIAAGAYFWWKKRQIASGNAAKMAFLPDVNFDLDRNDRRAFYTKMNWQNPGNSNWQLRGNASVHTKYSGKLLDWNADSHIGYRLNGKFGEFNPYLRGKFVQNAPENAEMEETYTLGVNYSVPNRFSVQFLQPDDEVWRYSLKTQVQLGRKIGLNFARPNSDLPDYSLGLRYQNPQGFGVSVTQPNSEINHYSLGIQWHGDSKVRYFLSGETANRALKLRGSISF